MYFITYIMPLLTAHLSSPMSYQPPPWIPASQVPLSVILTLFPSTAIMPTLLLMGKCCHPASVTPGSHY